MTELAISTGNHACALRSLVYASFAEAFEYPDAEMLEDVRSGNFARALRQMLTMLDPSLEDDTDWEALRGTGACEDDLLAEYTRLFLAGINGPVCALEEGVHRNSSLEVMEEALRYYKYFGLSLPDDRQEQPDHLKTELEFLHYLTYQEAQALAEGAEVDGLLRAQHDFIARHPGAWVPLMRRKLVASGAMPFFVELTRLLERYLDSEARRLGRTVGAGSSQPSTALDS